LISQTGDSFQIIAINSDEQLVLHNHTQSVATREATVVLKNVKPISSDIAVSEVTVRVNFFESHETLDIPLKIIW